MSLPTLTFRTVTYCTDARCMETGTCWRAAHERYGDANGENYGPRCTPVPMTRLSENAILPWSQLAELEVSLQALKEENAMLRDAVAEERAAVVAWLREVSPNAPTRRGADELAWCADAIKRGEHRREEER